MSNLGADEAAAKKRPLASSGEVNVESPDAWQIERGSRVDCAGNVAFSGGKEIHFGRSALKANPRTGFWKQIATSWQWTS